MHAITSSLSTLLLLMRVMVLIVPV